MLNLFNSGSKLFNHNILRENRREKSDLGVATDGDSEAMLSKDGNDGHERKREELGRGNVNLTLFPTFNLSPSMIFWTRIRHPCI
jgi:hypothetical protein